MDASVDTSRMKREIYPMPGDGQIAAQQNQAFLEFCSVVDIGRQSPVDALCGLGDARYQLPTLAAQHEPLKMGSFSGRPLGGDGGLGAPAARFWPWSGQRHHFFPVTCLDKCTLP